MAIYFLGLALPEAKMAAAGAAGPSPAPVTFDLGLARVTVPEAARP